MSSSSSLAANDVNKSDDDEKDDEDKDSADVQFCIIIIAVVIVVVVMVVVMVVFGISIGSPPSLPQRDHPRIRRVTPPRWVEEEKGDDDAVVVEVAAH